jgi:hypothetical protein
VNFENTRWLSSQERMIMRALEQGAMTLGQLRLTLPAADQRKPRVQAASLSRSLRRLVGRRLVESVNRKYARKTLG